MHNRIVLLAVALWGSVAFSCGEDLVPSSKPSRGLWRALGRVDSKAQGRSKLASLKDLLIEGRKLLGESEVDDETQRALDRVFPTLDAALFDRSASVRWGAGYVIAALRDRRMAIPQGSLITQRSPVVDARLKTDLDAYLRERETNPFTRVEAMGLARGPSGEFRMRLKIEVDLTVPIDLQPGPPEVPFPQDSPRPNVAARVEYRRGGGGGVVLRNYKFRPTRDRLRIGYGDVQLALPGAVGAFDRVVVLVELEGYEVTEHSFDAAQLSLAR